MVRLPFRSSVLSLSVSGEPHGEPAQSPRNQRPPLHGRGRRPRAGVARLRRPGESGDARRAGQRAALGPLGTGGRAVDADEPPAGRRVRRIRARRAGDPLAGRRRERQGLRRPGRRCRRRHPGLPGRDPGDGPGCDPRPRRPLHDHRLRHHRQAEPRPAGRGPRPNRPLVSEDAHRREAQLGRHDDRAADEQLLLERGLPGPLGQLQPADPGVDRGHRPAGRHLAPGARPWPRSAWASGSTSASRTTRPARSPPGSTTTTRARCRR